MSIDDLGYARLNKQSIRAWSRDLQQRFETNEEHLNLKEKQETRCCKQENEEKEIQGKKRVA